MEECKHSIEIEGMDYWMGMNQEDAGKTVQMKCCPRCKTIIRSCYRYGEIIKQNFQDIVKVKRMLLAGGENPREFAEKLQAKIVKALALTENLKPHTISSMLELGLRAIRSALTPRKVKNKSVFPSLHRDQRYLYQVQVDLIERLLDVMKNTPKVLPSSPSQLIGESQQTSSTQVKMKPDLILDILDRAHRLIDLLLNRERFSEEEHKFFISEIERIDLVRAYFMLQSSTSYAANASRLVKEKKELEDILVKNVKELTDREKTSTKTILETVDKILKTGLALTHEERQQIIRAVGLGHGHW